MKIISTLTTTNQRLSLARYTIESLFRQNLKPDSIYLNISDSPYLFDEGIKEIPLWLSELEHNGLIVNWVENIGPYRKLIPVLDFAGEQDMIITCDDDSIYHSSWLKYLVEGAVDHPDEILCGRARLISKNRFGKEKSYMFWPKIKQNKVGMDLIPIGNAGVLYRKRLLDLDFIRDPFFLKLAPGQDDIWFRFASMIKNIKVHVVGGVNQEVYPFGSGKGLSDINRFYYKHGMKNPLFAVNERIVKYVSGYFGKVLCENDVVYKQVKRYAHTVRSDFDKQSRYSREREPNR